ncbi:ice-binding family protein [Glycomyces rhizosphaerae]|uniref:Ice-binding family protein n=1 Tax=Glycomyces rhizosphaerae TaxID=2054422 RepID=A0ABV7Q3U5_9ACTN
MVAIPATVGIAAALTLSYPGGAQAQEAPVGLGTAADFSVLAGSTVTNTGDTTLEQSLGVSPGSAAVGFPPGTVGGETHLADGVADQAKLDLTTAYNDAAGRTPFTNLAAELGGETLTAGVYRISAAQLTGQLTLDLEEDPEGVFIFQIDSTLITASDSSVIFVNGASPCNVYWQVGSSATLGTGTDFIGNIMASASITMNTGATLEGRALAQTAAVTLDTNTITAPACAPTSPPTDGPTDNPTDGPGGPGGTDGPGGGSGGSGGATSSSDSDNDSAGSGSGSGSGSGLGSNDSAGGSGYGEGLPTTGNGVLTTVVAAGLALIAAGGLLAIFARRRARQD